MATHDPMDLNVRSQAFYQQFYLHHKNSCDAWYIKDANHLYVDASASFLSRFLSSNTTSVLGKDDGQVFGLSKLPLSTMHGFESQVITEVKELTVFSWDYFSDSKDTKSFVLKIKPYTCDDSSGTITYLYDLDSVNMSLDWIPSFLGCADNSSSANRVNTMYKDILPYSVLTEKEWEVAWLVIVGKSQRWIAGFLNLSHQAVEKRLKKIYLKLRVFDLQGLIQCASISNWSNHPPLSFLPKSTFCFSISC